MQTITVPNVDINGVLREVIFSQISEHHYEVTSTAKPKLVIKRHQGIFPTQNELYCVMHEYGIVFGKSPAETFAKATKRYWM